MKRRTAQPYTYLTLIAAGLAIYYPARARLVHEFEAVPQTAGLAVYITGVFILAGLLYVLGRLRLIHRQLQLENKKLKAADDLKNRLYTYLIHELRTPLTVIGGMAEQIRRSPDKDLINNLKTIQRNNANLLKLVNEILELRKLESGKQPLRLIQADIIPYLRAIVESFTPLAKRREVDLHFLNKIQEVFMDYDQELLFRVISNLLSNAIKFTPGHGHVYVFVDQSPAGTNKQTGEKTSRELLISVQDTGMGIPKDQLLYIFEPFYQVDIPNFEKGKGSGIGLALSQEFVHLMGGEITVESRPKKGTTFTIKLPVRRTAPALDPAAGFSPQDQLERELDPENWNVHELPSGKVAGGSGPEETTEVTRPQDPEMADTGSISGGKNKKPTLLIVEDNPEVVIYLTALLEQDYELSVAVDGQEGIDKAKAQIPDMIISDVMMPKKDGFELCQTLKSEQLTSHIPIIMLTARTTHEDRLEGLERGADAYLAKPFDQKELFIRLKKLHQLRKQLQARYSTAEGLASTFQQAEKRTPKHQPIDMEDAFVIKLRDIIQHRMSDKNFGIPELCKILGIGRTQLHLKLKALTNRSTSHFIRSVRMQKAREILQKGKTNVSETARMVGMDNPAYFSRVFTDEFGIPPSAVGSK